MTEVLARVQAADDVGKTLGYRLRTQRKKTNLTMREVAKATGLSTGFISQIERDISRPSLASLYELAKAMDTSIDTFVSTGVKKKQKKFIAHTGTRTVYSVGQIPARFEYIPVGFDRAMLNACISHVPPGYESDMNTQEGEEFVYLLSGELRYEVDGEIWNLKAGDTLHFQSSLPHRYMNISQETATELRVSTIQLFED